MNGRLIGQKNISVRFPPTQINGGKSYGKNYRITQHSNTQKYSDKKSFDGKPVEEGKVLVPFKKEDMNLMPGEYIDRIISRLFTSENSKL